MILILTPDRNTPTRKQPHRKDYTGAFAPEARLFQQTHGGEVVKIDQSKPATGRARAVLSAIHEWKPEFVAFFCHGLRRSITQMGFTITNVHELAGELVAACSGPRVVLYACSAANGITNEAPGGDGGFADQLRDACFKHGASTCTVWAHDRAGHTTQNPYVRCFDGAEHKANVGGQWVVDPKSALWKAWDQYLEGPGRFQFPFVGRKQLDGQIADAT